MFFRPLSLLFCAILATGIFAGCKKINSITNPQNPQTVQPETTPVGTPNGTTVSKSIGPSGGSIISDDGVAELIIPANALGTNTAISIQPITNNCPGGGPGAYRFTPDKLHFDQPVTIKFHYTDDDLKSTIADLMGIAFQDSTGAWYRFKDFTNDPGNKVISVSTNHFTDYSQFYILRITPQSATLKTGLSLGVQVNIVYSDDAEQIASGGSGDPSVLPIVDDNNATYSWSINQGHTDQDYGKFLGDATGNMVAYQAPAAVPTSGNPVAVAAHVNLGGTTFHGKKFNDTALVANIRIVDKNINSSFDVSVILQIMKTSDVYNDKYLDSASFTVDVNENGATLSNFLNYPPSVTPPSGSAGNTSAQWTPDATGITNITGGTAYHTVTAIPNTPDTIAMLFVNQGITPIWTVTDQFGPATSGGDPVVGAPASFLFGMADSVQHIYFTNGGTLSMFFTITPKQ